MGDGPALNEAVAEKLRAVAHVLAQQGANPFRVTAYRRASERVARLPRGVDEILRLEGLAGLDALPHIGPGIAAAVQEIVRTGRSSLLDRLRGTLDPVVLFATIPGVGPELARRIHDALGIDTLEELEVAAHDGRLAGVPGVGSRRLAGIRAALQALLDRTRLRSLPAAGGTRPASPAPAVALLLDVDQEYRDKAAAGVLQTIAPRRFNPEATAWLPVLHTARTAWHFTALYSNTAAAHQLGRTRDWVVIYFYDDHHREGQHTVVTETRGPLKGRRVVRGREDECGQLAGAPGGAASLRDPPEGEPRPDILRHGPPSGRPGRRPRLRAIAEPRSAADPTT